MNQEVLAGIKVLVALAQADGTIHDEERLAIENALDGVDLPAGTTVETLLASKIDVPAELAHLRSDDAKKRTYEAACALVYIDGEVSREERELLRKIEEALAVEEEGRSSRFVKFTSALPAAQVKEASNVTSRDAVVKGEIARAAEVSAVLATWSLPTAAESCHFTNNVHLARNLGIVYGHPNAEEAFWRTFASNIVGAAASWFAVETLLKLVPGTGAASAYATTFALGKATERYFEENESTSIDALREAFKTAKKEGLALAKDAKPRIAARKEQLDPAKSNLDADLASGKLTETDYADKLAALS
ncbi:MAG TPA: TerB family tellurite resistance protein [Labilithrix sp.]|jgi:uncharacterized protein (DUF697 family)/uncharacterized tellurite resistance protein B-like protein